LKKSLSAASASILGISSLAIPNIAMASIQDCGTAPTGATLTFSNGVCEAQFTTAGSFSFTVPSGASDLAAIAVGAGGGAYVDSRVGGDDGYTGSGGQVRYLNLSQVVAAGNSLAIVVGLGGVTQESATDGGESSLTAGSTPYVALGGVKGTVNNYCSLNGNYSTYLGMGSGAGGPAVFGPTPADACNTPGPGINPSLGSADNYSNSVPSLFTTFNLELGVGGKIAEAPAPLVQGFGQGGSVQVDLTTNSVSSSLDGSDGLVVLRWKPTVAPPATLASTGSDSSFWQPLGLAGFVMLGLGAYLFTTANQLKRRTKKH